MTTKKWAEQRRHQWACQAEQRKSHMASTLHKQLQATEEHWKKEQVIFPAKSTLIDCPMPNAHLGTQTTLSRLKTMFSNLCMHKYMQCNYLYAYIKYTIVISKKRQWLWGRVGEHGARWREEKKRLNFVIKL